MTSSDMYFIVPMFVLLDRKIDGYVRTSLIESNSWLAGEVVQQEVGIGSQHELGAILPNYAIVYNFFLLVLLTFRCDQ